MFISNDCAATWVHIGYMQSNQVHVHAVQQLLLQLMVQR